MSRKQIKEELVFYFADNEMGQELVVAYRRHVSDCPQGACTFLTVLRERTVRRTAPRGLRSKILASLPHRRD